MSDKVKVRIQCRGEWEWTGEVEMTRSEFKKLENMVWSDNKEDQRRAASIIDGSYMDPRDVDLGLDIEVEDFMELEP